MNSLLYSIIPVTISLLVLGLTLGVILLWRHRQSQQRWSPLTSKLLRSPGHSLIKKMEELDLEIDSLLFVVAAGPVWIYAAHISTSHFAGASESLFRIGLSVLTVCAMVFYGALKLVRVLSTRSRIREGYEAESAVGAELNHLMLDGAHVFHDLPAEGFNVDHIIVSPKGVFTVETKSRAKYVKPAEKADVKVSFDGNALRFPSHTEIAPVEQARANAKWVSEWLASATGEPVRVRPVVALPGWFTTTTTRSDLLVINGKGCRAVFGSTYAHQELSASQMQRIVFQIEQRCRDVEPTKYRKGAGAFLGGAKAAK